MWMGIDQGTTGTTCIAYDDKLRPVAEAYRALATRYPRPGWVEQEPEDIVRSVVEAVGAVLTTIGGSRRVDAVGLSNQGESVVAWDAGTGRALGPALVWSDRRGAEAVARLERAGQAGRVQRETGLRLDAYFSAAKMAWLLEHDRAVREAATTGTLRLGTLDTWLAWRLGGGRMLTDHSTASRTQLLGLRSGAWEPGLLDLFDVPAAALAEVRPSVEPRGALTHPSWGGALPWTASLVDQPAALAGHACFDRGDVKATYGTGCFVLVNAGGEPPAPPDGLLTSIAWSHDRQRVYAFDGGVFTAGTAITWLRSIGLIAGAEETAPLAASVADTDGVRFLPAVTGLGAPWWDGDARGAFTGLTAGTTRAHLVRAVLDSVAFRVRDVLEVVWARGAPRPPALRVDGGLARNGYLMQRQADLLGLPVERSAHVETTAAGTAALAAVGAGLLGYGDIRALLPAIGRYEPRTSRDERDADYASWRDWLRRARDASTAANTDMP